MTNIIHLPLRDDQIPLGVPRLDYLLKGGLFKGGVYVIQGLPGIGKTILANQICYEMAKQGGHSTYVSILAESSGRMVKYITALKFVDEDSINSKVHYINGYPILKKDGADGLLKMLQITLKKNNSQVLVIDGADVIESVSGSVISYREFVLALQSLSSLLNCTTILLTPLTENAKHHRAEHAVSDGIIEMTERSNGPRSFREIQILKFRGTNFLKGRHEFEITEEGIIVHPRTEVQFVIPKEGSYLEDRSRMLFGIPKLDAHLDGGLLSGSMTTLFGAPGTGKTSMGLAFLLAGAEKGEHGIYFGFYETPPRILEKSRKIGINLGQYELTGLLEIQWQQSVENIADSLAEKLLERIREKKQKKIRIFIDGMSGIRRAFVYPERFGSFLAALTNELRTLGATTIFSEELDLFQENASPETTELVSIVDNVIHLSYVKKEMHYERHLAVRKTRESYHNPSVEVFRITDDGFKFANDITKVSNIIKKTKSKATSATRAKK